MSDTQIISDSPSLVNPTVTRIAQLTAELKALVADETDPGILIIVKDTLNDTEHDAAFQIVSLEMLIKILKRMPRPPARAVATSRATMGGVA